MNGYGQMPQNGGVAEFHHYYGPNGQELSGPAGSVYSGQFQPVMSQPVMSQPAFQSSYTVSGMMQNGRVVGLDPDVSTPGVTQLPTSIIMELQRVYGHLGNARFSVTCSDGRFSIQAEVLPPPGPPLPLLQPPRRPGYAPPYGRPPRRARRRQGYDDYDDEEDDQEEIVIEIPMETYRELKKRDRNGRRQEIVIDATPRDYGRSDTRRRSLDHNQNNNAGSHAPPPHQEQYYERDDDGQLMQEYRRRNKGKKTDDDYDYDGHDTGRTRFTQPGRPRHSEGANTDMGAPPDSYIMERYLRENNARR